MMLVERIRNPRFLPLDTYPRAIDLAQRPIGKVILLALFALLMIPLKSITSVPITLAAGACAFSGQYRSPGANPSYNDGSVSPAQLVRLAG